MEVKGKAIKALVKKREMRDGVEANDALETGFGRMISNSGLRGGDERRYWVSVLDRMSREQGGGDPLSHYHMIYPQIYLVIPELTPRNLMLSPSSWESHRNDRGDVMKDVNP